jgi:hypothetical protein
MISLLEEGCTPETYGVTTIEAEESTYQHE